MINFWEPSLQIYSSIWQIFIQHFVLGSVLGSENRMVSKTGTAPALMQRIIWRRDRLISVNTNNHPEKYVSITRINDMKGNYQVLREHIARKLFKPEGCESVFEEVKGGRVARADLRIWKTASVTAGQKGRDSWCWKQAAAMAQRTLKGLVFILQVTDGREMQSVDFSRGANRQDLIRGFCCCFCLDQLDENSGRKSRMEANRTIKKFLHLSSPEQMVSWTRWWQWRRWI